jgi:hypothetical protein
MPRLLPWVLALVLTVGFALKLDRALSRPLGPTAAASGSLTRGLAELGWQPVGEIALLADASFTALAFQRDACRLEVALLPPGPQYLDIVREAWGSHARLLDQVELGQAVPGEARWRQLGRHLGHALGIGPRPTVFALAAAAAGACPLQMWPELQRLAR